MTRFQIFLIFSELILISSAIDKSYENSCGKRFPPGCPSSWVYWRDSCYNVTRPFEGWSDAKNACREIGGEMAAARSHEENDFFVSLAEEDSPAPWGVWIACDDRNHEGQWFCEGKNASTTFTNWKPGEPNQLEGEDCAAFFAFNQDPGRWSDVPCLHAMYPKPAICRRAPDALRLYCFTTNSEGRLNNSSCVRK